jgi:hypothetical protein
MKNNIGRTVIRISPIIAAILIVFEIILTNQLVGGGRMVRTTDMAIDTLRSENALLEQKVASASSLATVTVKAQEQGFVEPSKSQFLTLSTSELPVALANPR